MARNEAMLARRSGAAPVGPVADATQAAGADAVDSAALPAPRQCSTMAVLCVLLVLQAGVLAVFYSFTAEDALIVARYAENLIDGHGLVYNRGEYVSALTSPLHALVEAGLYAVTRSTLTANKLLGIGVTIAALAALLRYLRNDRGGQLLAAVLLLPSPFINLWAVGGLETPYLLGLVTALVLLVASGRATHCWMGAALTSLVMGLCILTRYDSALFIAPCGLYLLWKDWRKSAFYILPGAVVVGAWFGFAWFYYGDIFPTSVYIKPPDFSHQSLTRNTRYLVQFLLLSGAALVGLLVLARLRLVEQGKQAPRYYALRLLAATWWLWAALAILVVDFPYNYVWAAPVLLIGSLGELTRQTRWSLAVVTGAIRDAWWLWAGLAMIALYSLLAATVHMMFSYRLFVPYLPAMALAAAVPWRAAERARPLAHRAGRATLASAVVPMVVLQSATVVAIVLLTLNPGAAGEYRGMGIQTYADGFCQALTENAEKIRSHWAAQPESHRRSPRIWTFAAGYLPYYCREAHVYEKLVSYRKHIRMPTPGPAVKVPAVLRLSADYIHVMAPCHGPLDSQLLRCRDRLELVSVHTFPFDGATESIYVYYNPHPNANWLSNRVDDPCSAPPLPDCRSHASK